MLASSDDENNALYALAVTVRAAIQVRVDRLQGAVQIGLAVGELGKRYRMVFTA